MVHSPFGPIRHHHDGSVRRFFKGIIHLRLLSPGKTAENIVRQIHPRRLRPDPYLDPGKFLGSKLGNDIFNPIVPPCAAFQPNPELARLQADVIIDHDDLLRRDLIIIHRRPKALPAQIHEGLRLHKEHFLPLYHALPTVRPVLPFADIDTILVRQHINHRKTYIVPCFIIFLCGVSKSCNQIHNLFSLLSRHLCCQFSACSCNAPKALIFFPWGVKINAAWFYSSRLERKCKGGGVSIENA
jgi:hypothetical protein